MAVTDISESAIADVKSLLDLASENEVVVRRGDFRFHITREPRRALSELLADPSAKWLDVTPDEDFAKDLEEIIAMRKLPERDPWAE